MDGDGDEGDEGRWVKEDCRVEFAVYKFGCDGAV